jgi:hypothetical protein
MARRMPSDRARQRPMGPSAEPPAGGQKPPKFYPEGSVAPTEKKKPWRPVPGGTWPPTRKK